MVRMKATESVVSVVVAYLADELLGLVWGDPICAVGRQRYEQLVGHDEAWSGGVAFERFERAFDLLCRVRGVHFPRHDRHELIEVDLAVAVLVDFVDHEVDLFGDVSMPSVSINSPSSTFVMDPPRS